MTRILSAAILLAAFGFTACAPTKGDTTDTPLQDSVEQEPGSVYNNATSPGNSSMGNSAATPEGQAPAQQSGTTQGQVPGNTMGNAVGDTTSKK